MTAARGTMWTHSTWGLSGSGLALVIRLELRQRVRSTRWVLSLVVWTLAVGALTALFWRALHDPYTDGITDNPDGNGAGRAMFGATVLLILALGSLIAPALSATSINGDRAAGVLASLQTTLLTPAELGIGKLLAAWFTSWALLVTAGPFILWAYLEGGTPFLRLVVVLLVLMLLLLVVCAIGLGWSAIAARTTSSAVLTYLSVAFLTLGMPLLFALLSPVVSQEEEVPALQYVETGSDKNGTSATCRWTTETLERSHTERIWWLLAPNPVVLVADTGPLPDTNGVDLYDEDPLAAIRNAVRGTRLGPAKAEVWCEADNRGQQLLNERAYQEATLGPVWPWGLAFDLAVAGAFTVGAVRRLRTPTRTLPRGVRVA